MKQKRLFILISLLLILIVIHSINPFGLPSEELTKLAIEAVEDGNIKKVRSLIAKGAKFNTPDKKGETLLHIAADWGEKDITKLLISKGADVNIKNKYGITPLGLAIGRRKHIAELPEAKNADGYIERGIYFYR